MTDANPGRRRFHGRRTSSHSIRRDLPEPGLARSLLVGFLVPSMLVIVAACSGIAPSPSPRPTPSPIAADSGATPQPTRWPSDVFEAAIALGAADNDFPKFGSDLAAAVDAGDLKQLLDVTAQVEQFLSENAKNIPPLQGYPATKSVGDRLAPAYAQMLAGVTQIHDSLASGNAPGVTQGFQTFVAGNTAYAAVRADLGDIATQAIFMKRILLR